MHLQPRWHRGRVSGLCRGLISPCVVEGVFQDLGEVLHVLVLSKEGMRLLYRVYKPWWGRGMVSRPCRGFMQPGRAATCGGRAQQGGVGTG